MRKRSVQAALSGAAGLVVCLVIQAPGAIAADSRSGYGEFRHDWDGFYAGLHAGYSWGGADGSALWGSTTGDRETYGYGIKGALGGIHAGYNQQIGDIVFGIEADIAASDIKGEGHSTSDMIHDSRIDAVSSVRFRLGFTAGHTLLYIAGGPTAGHLETSQRIPSAVVSYSENSEWKLGWTIGGGIEQALSDRLSLRFDYRYTDFGHVSYRDAAMIMTEKTRLDDHAIRVGLSFKF